MSHKLLDLSDSFKSKSLFQVSMDLKRKNLVGNFVKMAREKSRPKLTQEALAVRLQLLGWTDCDRFTVSKIELGTRRVIDFEVDLLSKALKVSADWLLGNEREAPGVSSREKVKGK